MRSPCRARPDASSSIPASGGGPSSACAPRGLPGSGGRLALVLFLLPAPPCALRSLLCACGWTQPCRASYGRSSVMHCQVSDAALADMTRRLGGIGDPTTLPDRPVPTLAP